MTFNEYKKLRDLAFKLVGDASGEEMRYFSPYKNQPYWTHLMNVHNFLAIKGETDYETLLAAILHDIIEDSDVNEGAIRQEFGSTVLDLVLMVSKQKGQNEDNFYNKILNYKNNNPAKIKVADRIDNILTNYCYSGTTNLNKEKLIENKKYFIPLAKKVGWEKDFDTVLSYYKEHL